MTVQIAQASSGSYRSHRKPVPFSSARNGVGIAAMSPSWPGELEALTSLAWLPLSREGARSTAASASRSWALRSRMGGPARVSASGAPVISGGGPRAARDSAAGQAVCVAFVRTDHPSWPRPVDMTSADQSAGSLPPGTRAPISSSARRPTGDRAVRPTRLPRPARPARHPAAAPHRSLKSTTAPGLLSAAANTSPAACADLQA